MVLRKDWTLRGSANAAVVVSAVVTSSVRAVRVIGSSCGRLQIATPEPKRPDAGPAASGGADGRNHARCAARLSTADCGLGRSGWEPPSQSGVVLAMPDAEA